GTGRAVPGRASRSGPDPAPRDHALAAPALLRLLPGRECGACDPGGAARSDAELGRHPVAHRARLDRARGDRPRLGRPADRAAGAWLHVDAAYAGSAMVCPELRWAFEGVERADSLVVNAHKWMFTPMDCSLLWTSRPTAFREAFSLIPEYLRTTDEDAFNISEYGPALGRRFRSL